MKGDIKKERPTVASKESPMTLSRLAYSMPLITSTSIPSSWGSFLSGTTDGSSER